MRAPQDEGVGGSKEIQPALRSLVYRVCARMGPLLPSATRRILVSLARNAMRPPSCLQTNELSLTIVVELTGGEDLK
jgi:hypothetical protein